MAVHVTLEEGIGRLVLDEPPLNILSQTLMADLRQELGQLEGKRELRVLILSAEGKHFSAGASVEEHLPGSVAAMIPEFMETVGVVQAFPLPTVAAVHGRCLGGAFELALGADLIVAGEGAVFGVPEIQLGVFPPAACVQLPIRAGPSLAAELIFTGGTKQARELADTGLIARVVPDGRVLEEAISVASSIARHSGASLRAAKQALTAGRDGWKAASARVTSIYLEELMSTRDAVEGLTSFLEKRPPEWSHS
ncbi:MAG: enoyl-CoA hydratase/isomerase family protein [Gemmatimonadota bacterium]|nr:enoyl-CoA hydratase/isomerase family protein [Gemmatimonadota bacterium]